MIAKRRAKKPARETAADLIREFEALLERAEGLEPEEREQFHIDVLRAALYRPEARPFREFLTQILEESSDLAEKQARRRRKEDKARNGRICALHAEGLTAGAIGRRLDLNRDQVAGVLRRRRKRNDAS